MAAQNKQYLVTLWSGAALVAALWGTQIALVRYSPILEGHRIYEYCIISLVAIIGSSMGWFLGVLVSPQDKAQWKQFQIVSAAIGTFFSGFLLSRLNTGFDWLFKENPEHPTLLIRATFGMGWFVIAFTITFLTRTFAAKDE